MKKILLYPSGIFFELRSFKSIDSPLKLSLMFLFLVALLATLICHQNTYAQKKQKYVIGSVDIVRSNVFPGEQDQLKGIQRTANKFHSLTKENVITRELLFQAGDTLELELIDETERRLRKFDFLGVADIDIDTINNHTVTVEVYTEDQWSLIPSYIIESGGGLIGLGASIEESNLFGYGKSVYFEGYNESDVGTTWSFAFFDPRLFGSKYRSAIGLSSGPLNETFYLSVYMPYFYSDSKWTYGVDFLVDDEIQRLFYEGKEFSRLLLERTSIKGDLGYAFGERYKKKRLKLKYRYTVRDFRDLGEETNSPVPEDEIIAATSIGFSVENQKFSKETHIDHFKRVEDITLGRKTGITIGKPGFPIPVGVDRWEISTYHNHAFQFSSHQYLFAGAGFKSWIEKNTILSASALYYWQASHLFTLALNTEFAYAWDLEEHRQFTLGGESGLRGYKAREFGGDKFFLTNLEGRFFPSIEFLTIELGTIVFIDAGYAWRRPESLDFNDLRYSTGFGFRFGFLKAPGETVARWDFGFPINQSGGMEMTFGIGQHF